MSVIKPLKQSRTEVISALMEPWISRQRISKLELDKAIKVIDLSRENRRMISNYVDDYAFLGGELFWETGDIPKLQKCLKAILHITEKEFDNILYYSSPDVLRDLIRSKTAGFNEAEIDEICNVLTKVEK